MAADVGHETREANWTSHFARVPASGTRADLEQRAVNARVNLAGGMSFETLSLCRVLHWRIFLLCFVAESFTKLLRLSPATDRVSSLIPINAISNDCAVAGGSSEAARAGLRRGNSENLAARGNDRSTWSPVINVTRTGVRVVHVARQTHARRPARTYAPEPADPRLYVISPRLERGSEKLCE